MGWASGRDVFDGLAKSAIKANLSEELMWEILAPLIDFLQDQDWDTEDESLQEFGDNLVIRAIFYSRGVGSELDLYPAALGKLQFNELTREWCLNCEECGLEFETTYAEFTRDGHNRLCRLFFHHARTVHGYKGQEAVTHWLIGDCEK